jgi:hypothetical protein
MKLIYSSILFISFLASFPANASCTIGFENEVTEWEPMHKLFKYAVANKEVLASKGYQLILIENDPEPGWVGTIEIKRFQNRRVLTFDLYDFETETNRHSRTRFTNYESGIKDLFKKMPICH